MHQFIKTGNVSYEKGCFLKHYGHMSQEKNKIYNKKHNEGWAQ